ncbi:transcriptional regulator [Robertkochia aurantiaca]|uniref:transcriptional regulator n=1 Tax=Robertkochia aurantiaca TaxID=2873700 RepID=UPI001CCB2E75|nr:transcriptional regulator [Robertkochia sp. 3YJGBD-33]
MTSVITGDIINSRKAADPELWLPSLKKVLTAVTGSEKLWEIFRGDSFQLEVRDVYHTFEACMRIKATVKMVKGLDVRMAIGIGELSDEYRSISEAAGQVFIFSGERFETLKKSKTNLAIKSVRNDIDEDLNLIFRLLGIATDNWTVNSAEIVKLSLENQKKSQSELGQMIGIKQNTVSERQKRAYLEEVMAVDTMFKKKIDHIQHPD